MQNYTKHVGDREAAAGGNAAAGTGGAVPSLERLLLLGVPVLDGSVSGDSKAAVRAMRWLPGE